MCKTEILKKASELVEVTKKGEIVLGSSCPNINHFGHIQSGLMQKNEKYGLCILHLGNMRKSKSGSDIQNCKKIEYHGFTLNTTKMRVGELEKLTDLIANNTDILEIVEVLISMAKYTEDKVTKIDSVKNRKNIADFVDDVILNGNMNRLHGFINALLIHGGKQVDNVLFENMRFYKNDITTCLKLMASKNKNACEIISNYIDDLKEVFAE